MFEKEAEEYGNEYWDCLVDSDDKGMLQEAYKDGAEFGYNKANEDADKMKSRFLELCNLKDMRIAELEKANEQIEKLKNCKNCSNYLVSGKCGNFSTTGICKNWEMQK